MTPLCLLANKYGVDKCPEVRHSYTPFYYNLLKDRSIKKVLEVGIGHYEGIGSEEAFYHSRLDRVWVKGGSLKMWRDFFPEAMVYGVDILADCMFTDERIKTFQGDERSPEDWDRILGETGVDIDLFIDDGLHHPRFQIDLCKLIVPKLKKGALYIIEDAKESDRIVGAFPGLHCEVPDLMGQQEPERLVVIKV